MLVVYRYRLLIDYTCKKHNFYDLCYVSIYHKHRSFIYLYLYTISVYTYIP